VALAVLPAVLVGMISLILIAVLPHARAFCRSEPGRGEIIVFMP
jgi:hypothetical protein